LAKCFRNSCSRWWAKTIRLIMGSVMISEGNQMDD
jgi:hypothetical protein